MVTLSMGRYSIYQEDSEKSNKIYTLVLNDYESSYKSHALNSYNSNLLCRGGGTGQADQAAAGPIVISESQEQIKN